MKKFNFDEFVWFITLILMAAALSYMIQTGKIQFYIGNKMVKYIYFAIFMISVIAVFQIKNIFTPKNSLNLKVNYIPILLALIIGAVSVKSQDSFRHRQLNNMLINEYTEDHEISNNKHKSEKKEYGQFIKVNDDNVNVLEDIQDNPEQFIGKEIEIYGFACKEGYLKNNQIVIGRIIMTCCAADSKIVGILVEDKDVVNINENEWITVRGIISYTTIIDDQGITHKVPAIMIDSLDKSNKPENKS